MGFLIVYLLIGSLCSALGGYALTAHANYPLWVIFTVYAVFLFSWFSPIAVWRWQHRNDLPSRIYNAAAYVCYALFGVAFLLFALLILRDFVWYTAYIFGLKNPSPFVPTTARTANNITLLITLLCSLYALYAAQKLPRVLHYKYHDARVKRPLRLLVVSDWHINRTIAPRKISQYTEFFKCLRPDIILLPGDIADDTPQMMRAQLSALQRLSAPLGIYYTLGNHEIYHYAPVWEAEFAALGWQVLHNSGVAVENTGVYIGGVPDSAAAFVNVKQAMRRAAPSDYRILLSHTPTVMRLTDNGDTDLVVAGHTHGGQIFPFNFITKFGNAGFVAGEYRESNATLLLSRGAGYWGPPMRLFAPSDVLLVELKP